MYGAALVNRSSKIDPSASRKPYGYPQPTILQLRPDLSTLNQFLLRITSWMMDMTMSSVIPKSGTVYCSRKQERHPRLKWVSASPNIYPQIWCIFPLGVVWPHKLSDRKQTRVIRELFPEWWIVSSLQNRFENYRFWNKHVNIQMARFAKRIQMLTLRTGVSKTYFAVWLFTKMNKLKRMFYVKATVRPIHSICKLNDTKDWGLNHPIPSRSVRLCYVHLSRPNGIEWTQLLTGHNSDSLK